MRGTRTEDFLQQIVELRRRDANVYRDRNLVCSSVGMEAYADAPKA